MADSASTPLPIAWRRCRPALIAAALFSGILNLLTLALPLHSMQVMDRVLASRSQDTLIFLTLAALATILLASVLEAVRGRLLARAAEWLEATLAGPACRRLIEGALDGGMEAADPLRDLALLRAALSEPAMLALFDLPWIPVFLVAITLLHPLMGVLAAATSVLLVALAILGDRMSRRALETAAKGSRGLQQTADAAVRCAPSIDAMGLLPGLEARWHGMQRIVLAAQRQAGDRSGLLLALSRFARRVARPPRSINRRRHDGDLDHPVPRPGPGRSGGVGVAPVGGGAHGAGALETVLPPSAPAHGRHGVTGSGRSPAR
jgi:ABC-type protease/lipase transport system fused ATPase/permease subunit